MLGVEKYVLRIVRLSSVFGVAGRVSLGFSIAVFI